MDAKDYPRCRMCEWYVKPPSYTVNHYDMVCNHQDLRYLIDEDGVVGTDPDFGCVHHSEIKE
jgi:hypothetical protein